MGKYMKKCRGVGEVAAMEVTQVVGVRTRSRAAAAAAAAAEEEAKKTKEAAAAAEGEVEGYMELRSRRLAMATRTPRSTANSGSGGGGGGSGGGCPSRSSRGTISRCSSNASSAAAAALQAEPAAAGEEIKDDARSTGSSEPEGCNDLESSVSYTECNRGRRETTPLSELRDAESEERRKRRRSGEATRSPSESEIEEFFATTERAEAERFATKYNFDVVNEVPLDGRYEWVRLSNC